MFVRISIRNSQWWHLFSLFYCLTLCLVRKPKVSLKLIYIHIYIFFNYIRGTQLWGRYIQFFVVLLMRVISICLYIFLYPGNTSQHFGRVFRTLVKFIRKQEVKHFVKARRIYDGVGLKSCHPKAYKKTTVNKCELLKF